MMHSPKTRESLILRLPSSADVEAWQEFTAIYEPLIYQFARRRGLQDADAHELVQDVFISVARAVEGWKPDPSRGRFRAWLFRIARNQLINQVRKRRPDSASGKTSSMLALQQLAEGNDEEEWDADYRRELFRSASAFVRDTVQEKTWQAFWRTAIEGQSIEHVSAELEMSASAIYIARSRIIHRLRELVQQWESEDA